MVPVGRSGMMGGGMMGAPEVEAEEPELDSDAKIEAIRSALKELVSIVGGISVEEAKAKKAGPPAALPEVETEEE